MRPNPQVPAQVPADLVTFTEQICNGKHFLCSAGFYWFGYQRENLLCRKIQNGLQLI